MANYYAVPFPIFQRSMRNILTMTQSYPVLVTTTYDGINPEAHQYMTGLIARLDIPQGFGMQLANQFIGPITVVNSTQFTMDLDTTLFDAFVVPAYNPGHFGTPPQVVPVGEVSNILTEATQNVLPYTS